MNMNIMENNDDGTTQRCMSNQTAYMNGSCFTPTSNSRPMMPSDILNMFDESKDTSKALEQLT